MTPSDPAEPAVYVPAFRNRLAVPRSGPGGADGSDAFGPGPAQLTDKEGAGRGGAGNPAAGLVDGLALHAPLRSPAPPKSTRVAPLKRLERGLTALFKLGRTETMTKRAVRAIANMEPEVERLPAMKDDIVRVADAAERTGAEIPRLHARLDEAKVWLQDTRAKADAIAEQLAGVDGGVGPAFRAFRRELDRFDDTLRSVRAETGRTLYEISRRLDAAQALAGAAAGSPGPQSDTAREDPDLRAFLDRFYTNLENAYRGPQDEIARRLAVYLPDIHAARARTGALPAIDLGCGRGEWLALMKEEGIDAFGIDTNPEQIAAAETAGLDIRLGEAVHALETALPESASVITAHHLVEHLPFETVARLTRAAFRVLAPGGLLLYETPNTANVLVGATTFHTDPTHVRPMPEQVLHVLFETAGFDPVERRPLNPHERLEEFRARPGFDAELANLLFGPQDLAVLGVRPGAAAVERGPEHEFGDA
jgi:O-antigen chain-terminating methyltransferase